jgi:hypothetical protein
LSRKKQKPIKAAQPTPQRPWWLWAAVVVAVFLVVGGLTVMLTSTSTSPESGAPKVVVDRTEIDEGYQKLNSTIRTSFTLRNEGTSALQILGEPEVKLVEGC